MAIEIPDALTHLEANCGVFALWMLLQHHGVHIEIADLAQACRHDAEEGTFTIALSLALKKLGFDVSFYTAPDPNISASERQCYADAKALNIPIKAALTYAEIQHSIEQGNMAIVYYDTLDGIGNQSLVYSIDDREICFFDSFESMPKQIFEQQRHAEGICAQAILIDDRSFVPNAIRSN
ncbi:cysteine peptidase family C39 domain-containing protein [Acinetobacter sp. MD2(2019)]|uniref:cysteine peptidase family C39 domain-containing protein n=1 Tax=Acinetobacter sp. MD2(2019) TaxID=2605273 RepID=UPI002D1EAB88|nr:cysteine peptidase family C39 domain-containing protein [Acinetobacter sp. MD2(2019)]MEB3754140.1 peptidase C39 [Acinetobacter sp. MD2(2019)]